MRMMRMKTTTLFKVPQVCDRPRTEGNERLIQLNRTTSYLTLSMKSPLVVFRIHWLTKPWRFIHQCSIMDRSTSLRSVWEDRGSLA